MSFKKYLSDKRYLILFYCVLMSFISLVIYLDDIIEVNSGNILYINIISTAFFLLYLGIEFLLKKKYYASLNEIVKENKNDLIYRLPDPPTHEQYLYHQLLRNLFKEQNTKIKELLNEKKDHLEFITSWVHGVKTPIAVSRLILENNQEKKQEEIFNSLEEEIEKIENFVEQALYYSRIDAFAKDYFIKDVQLERVIKESIKKHAKTFINKRIKIELADLNHDVTTDKKWLTFIIHQIIDNALKYTNEAGKIRVYAEKDEKETRLIIQDNGIGIKVEDLLRVFDKGFTGYNGREKDQSTGLGLYLAKKLARKLGHDLSIDSKYQEYTSVTIHFPKLLDYFKVTKM